MRVPRLLRPLSRHCGGRRFGEFLRYIVSPNNHVAVKWRHCFNWKARTQNGERLRRKRERNEYGCTFHVPRSYRKQSSDGKVILQKLRCRWWSPSQPTPYNGASEHGSGEPVEKSGDDNKAMETNKDGGFERIGSAGAPQMQMAN